MRPALVIGHRVNFIDDQGAHRSQHLARFFRGQQNIERLGRGHQNMRRFLAHFLALGCRGIAGANGGADRRERDAFLACQFSDLTERHVEILVHVVAERFERRNIKDVDARWAVRLSALCGPGGPGRSEMRPEFSPNRWARRSGRHARPEFPAIPGAAARSPRGTAPRTSAGSEDRTRLHCHSFSILSS